jgi:hypothetical protein
MSKSQPGNQAAKKGKQWFDALRKECVQRDALAKIATAVVDAALAGERWAVEEVANRFDGKPAQSVELSGDPENPVAFQKIERAIVHTSD